MNDLIDFVGAGEWVPKAEDRKDTDIQTMEGPVTSDTVLSPPDAAVVSKLEQEVDSLRHCVQDLFVELQQRSQPQTEKPIRHLMKPRDIPTLELQHLKGVEGIGRLEVFFSQVESCSLDNQERQQIVQILGPSTSHICSLVVKMLTSHAGGLGWNQLIVT